MKTKYKVLVVYLMTTFVLYMFVIMMPSFLKVEYQEVVISEPITLTEEIRTGAVSINKRNANNSYYVTTCHRMNNGEPIKRGRHYYKNFCGNISNIDNVTVYKKITNIYGLNIKNSRELFIKQIDYIDIDNNNVSFKIPENLFNKYIKEYLSRSIYFFVYYLY